MYRAQLINTIDEPMDTDLECDGKIRRNYNITLSICFEKFQKSLQRVTVGRCPLRIGFRQGWVRLGLLFLMVYERFIAT